MLDLLKENYRAEIDTPSLPNTCPLSRKERSAWRWRYIPDLDLAVFERSTTQGLKH
jgi:hypothetical protein